MLIMMMMIQQFPTMIHSALPPGYEDDHIMCKPLTACLRPVFQPHGWSGSRIASVECCDSSSSGTGKVSRPRGWGKNMDYEYLMQLWREGYGEVHVCTVEEAAKCGRNNNNNNRRMMELESVVDQLASLYV